MQAAFIIVLNIIKFMDFIERFLFIKGQTFRCSIGLYPQVERMVRRLYSFGCYRKIYSQLVDKSPVWIEYLLYAGDNRQYTVRTSGIPTKIGN